MLIIGRRGAAGIAPENTLPSLHAGFQAQVDILQFDIYVAKDDEPVLLDEITLKQIQQLRVPPRSLTYQQLLDLTPGHSPVKLDKVLRTYFGKVLLNIELKSKGGAEAVVAAIKNYAGSKQTLWDNVLISSFKAGELMAARKASKRANLALLHDMNPFAYITYQPFLDLTAVGFHRLHLNSLALEIAKKAGLFTYAYTVDRPDAVRRLEARGIDGIMTNRPDTLIKSLQQKT
ncbi:glycerophosphodiester phosphodiesterase [Candidatus Saccharibacteria bacterium]|nr:glycerophosphodiester phosphodiesterase [Candidatus Saccharibacteria bacterium]